MEESYRYKVAVVGSSPTVATILVRNSIGFRVPVFYTGSCEFESHRANKSRAGRRGCMHLTANQEKEVRFFCTTQWMNSSMAERRLVKPMVENSNLSLSAIRILGWKDYKIGQLKNTEN